MDVEFVRLFYFCQSQLLADAAHEGRLYKARCDQPAIMFTLSIYTKASLENSSKNTFWRINSSRIS